MTNEEAKKVLEKVKMHFAQIGRFSDDTRREACEALDMAIEALSAKTGGDTISRQDAIETSLEFFIEFLGGEFHENAQKELIARLQRLPSAEPRTGKWVWKDRHIKRTQQVKGLTANGEETVVSVHEDYIEIRPYCSECGKWNNSDYLNYCPNCGADMRGK